MDTLLEILSEIFKPGVFLTIGSIFFTALFVLTATYLLYKAINRRPQQYFYSNLLISKALDVICVNIVQGTTYKFRANFFMPNKKGDLEIRYYSSSMIGAKDFNLVLKPGKGVTGIAWAKKEPIVAKLSKSENAVEWGLNREEVDKTKHLKAILSIPTAHPKFKDRYIGILSVDSEDDASEHFQKQKVLEMAYTASLQIANILMGCGIIK